jgi:hypothetical protein
MTFLAFVRPMRPMPCASQPSAAKVVMKRFQLSSCFHISVLNAQRKIMFQTAKLLFVAALATLVTACAAPGPKFTGAIAPVNDRGDVYLYRTSSIYAVAQAFDVALDGKPVGSLQSASYLHWRLPAGKYALKVSPGGSAKVSEIQIAPEAGRASFYQFDFQYEFILGVYGNASFPNSSIQPRSAEAALLAMKELNAAN